MVLVPSVLVGLFNVLTVCGIVPGLPELFSFMHTIGLVELAVTGL